MRGYHPDESDMTNFPDRSKLFNPQSHKGRTQRERAKNQKRLARRAARDNP